MAGHSAWRNLRADFTAEECAQIDALKQQMLQEMELHQLREQARVSQVEMAERLQTAQGAVSRLERRLDLKLSTLREYVRAIGGQLEVRAVFRDRVVILKHLGAIKSGLARRRAR